MRRLRRSQSTRRGGTIIMVIAFFAIAMAMAGGWVRSSLSQQRQTRLWLEKTQVNWLASAGVRRAIARRAKDRSYEGEVWNIASADLERHSTAKVIIRLEPVEAVEDAEPKLQITAVATYPAGEDKRVQTTRTAQLPLLATTIETGEAP